MPPGRRGCLQLEVESTAIAKDEDEMSQKNTVSFDSYNISFDQYSNKYVKHFNCIYCGKSITIKVPSTKLEFDDYYHFSLVLILAFSISYFVAFFIVNHSGLNGLISFMILFSIIFFLSLINIHSRNEIFGDRKLSGLKIRSPKLINKHALFAIKKLK